MKRSVPVAGRPKRPVIEPGKKERPPLPQTSLARRKSAKILVRRTRVRKCSGPAPHDDYVWLCGSLLILPGADRFAEFCLRGKLAGLARPARRRHQFGNACAGALGRPATSSGKPKFPATAMP